VKCKHNHTCKIGFEAFGWSDLICAICFPGFNPFGQARAQFNIRWQRQSLNSSLIASNLSFGQARALFNIVWQR